MAKDKAPPANRWQSRIVGEGEEAPDQLLANPLNFRVHPGEQAQALAGALGEVGWVTRVVVNRRTGHVIDGHLRVKLALQRGEATVPVTYVDLDENQERLALATLDPISAMAGHDDAILAELLNETTTQDPALAEFLAELHPDQDGDGGGEGGGSTPDIVLPPVPVTKPGERIALGDHVLLCGDSTNPAHVARLLAGQAVDLVFTDPPYAIFGSSTGVTNDVADDKMVRPFFRDILRTAKGALRPFGHLYVCCDWRSWSAWWAVAAEVELAVKNCIVWDKVNMGMGAMYRNTHELLLFATNAPKMKKTGERGLGGERTIGGDGNVWHIARADKAERDSGGRHNAIKPQALVARAVENSTDPGQAVLDLFGGSGSTLLACESLGRRAYVMEMEPAWCDVIVSRWETATGQVASRTPPPATDAP